MNLRRVLCWLLVVIGGVLAACAPPASPPSQELALYGFAEYVPQTLLTGFEEETGIRVTYQTYSTNEEMLAGLAANPATYDLIIPSDYTVELLINQDALRPLDLAAIPAYSNIDPAFLSPYFDPGGATSGRRPALRNQKFSLPYLWGTTGIAYDPTRVAEPITRWADLWRPDLAGHVVVLDDAREVMGLTLLTLGYDKNDTDPAHLAEARDKLLELAPNLLAIDADTPERALQSGEAWAGVLYNGNAALARASNPALLYIFPEEGAGIWFDNLAIPKDAPHPDAAHAFINYLLQPENSLVITQQFPYSTPNEAALRHLEATDPDRFQSYAQSPVTNPADEVRNRARLVKNLDPESAARYEALWAEVKAAQESTP